MNKIDKKKCSSVVGGFCLLENKICPGWCKRCIPLSEGVCRRKD